VAITDQAAARHRITRSLRRHQFFKTLPDRQLETLSAQAACRTFTANEVIFLDGGPCAGMWIIGEGRVKIYKLSNDGSEHIMRLLGPGDSFNDVAALDGGPNPANAATLSAVTACTLGHEALMAAIMADPLVAQTVIQLLARHSRVLVQQIEDLALYSVTTRLARFLLQQTENPSLSGPGITRAAIAAHLAVTPETVSRALSSMEKSGAISVDRQAIAIRREDLLRLMALL